MHVLSRMFKALSDETRLSIVALLSWEPTLCVCDLMAVLDIPQPSVSRHMKILSDAGLAEGRREGVWVHYRLSPENDAVAKALLKVLDDAFATQAHRALETRLRQYLADKNACCRTATAEDRVASE